MILVLCSRLLRDVVANDTEPSLLGEVFDGPSQGVLGILSHVISLVQNDDLVIWTFDIPELWSFYLFGFLVQT